MFSVMSLAFVLQVQDFDANKAWDTVSGRIKALYWARKSDPEKLDNLLKGAEPAARAAKSIEDFNKAMDTMIAAFGDSHFDFMTREDQGFYLFDGLMKGDKAVKLPNIGAWFKPGTDGYTVKMVLEGGGAAEGGLRKGDLVTSIDGKRFSPVSSFTPLVGKQANLTVKRGGQQLDIKVNVTESAAQDMFLEATRKSGRIIEHGGKKFGYIHLWTMSGEKFKTALESFVYNRAADTDAFILDIRDGFGGRPEGYGDPFFRPEARLEWTMGPGGTMNQLFGYGRPLILIVNEGSRSAKEVFSFLMKKSGRATLVGTKTAGDVLGTTPNPVGDWAYLEIPMVDVKVDGVRLEKNPVVADVQVSREFDSAGKDLFLEKAIEVALEKASAR